VAGRCVSTDEAFQPSAAYPWMDVMLEAAAADTLARFTGSDAFGYEVQVMAGSLTEPGVETPVTLSFPTCSGTADGAGVSRLYGDYHIAADNVEGLRMGQRVSAHIWPVLEAYFDGTAEIENPLTSPDAD
jgi:hypothetical protein